MTSEQIKEQATFWLSQTLEELFNPSKVTLEIQLDQEANICLISVGMENTKLEDEDVRLLLHEALYYIELPSHFTLKAHFATADGNYRFDYPIEVDPDTSEIEEEQWQRFISEVKLYLNEQPISILSEVDQL